MPKNDHGEVEKTFKKMTPHEHILLRPDTYIGSVEHITDKLWVYDKETSKLLFKSITYVPGLYKIFDEILVNAIDNITRDLSMNTIKVNIDDKSISIYNNGKGIPITIHKTYNLYVPELIFGHLLTSSNYDDNIKKITGGRNGYGAKLTNIFSKKFIVETGDKKSKKTFRMEWTNNMLKHSEPEITTGNTEDFTKIYFEPDFKKFSMTKIDDDIRSLLIKRVYDVAGTTPSRVNVYLNGKKVEVKSFNDYIDLYLKNKYYDEGNKIEFPKIIACNTERWEVAFSMADSSFQQVSFVNGICTSKGGTHVNYIVDQVTERIAEHIKKKAKEIKLNANQIKQNLWVFINCFIENPSFDSQTKENLTSKVESFGSKCALTEKFMKELLKSIIVTNIIDFGKAKQRIKLNRALSSNIKKASRLLGIEKLEDANLAGTKDFEECTLILTEGDSAKSLALAGIEVVGRDKYGVFPLKGKLLNVRNAKDKQILQNEEIQNIIKILGLRLGMDYSSELKGLRYGHLLVMADQDYDGSHIKGLVINFIHNFWPSLIKRGNFLHEFITPIVKATKEGVKDEIFFTMKQYREWYEQNKTSGYKIKYYKGLGTSTTKEGKEYFSNIKKNKIDFFYVDQEDDQAIELAFGKKDIEVRKEWLSKLDIYNTFIDHSAGVVRYKDFINKELIFFSNYDNIRSIPSMMDGLKPSERKIVYGCFKRNLKNEIKVAQLVGYISEHSSYHHGEMSLSQTITAMGQDFTGSNNLNLLIPGGQFGSRYNGIKGAASPRYIFTTLNPLTRKVFLESDDPLLTYQVEEGMKIEPVWYVPIIPMVLVNGAEGIGTGWSTSVPQFNPIEIAENLLKKINGQEMTNLSPWYKGFTGQIRDETVEGKCCSYSVVGKFSLHEEERCIEITELPVKVWIRDYKSFLEKNHIENKDPNPNKEFEVEDIKEYHTDNTVNFIVKLTESSFEKVKSSTQDQVNKMFKLTSSISTSNMVLYDPNNKIKKYQNVKEIMEDFYTVRLDYYGKKKEYLLSKMSFVLEKNKNKQKFIELVLSNKIPFKSSKNKKEIFDILKQNGILSLEEIKKKYPKCFEQVKSTEVIIKENDTDEDAGLAEKDSGTDFDYLFGMNIWSLTSDKVAELANLIEKSQNEYETLKNQSPSDLWKNDLEEFISLYKIVLSDVENKEKEVELKIKKLKNKTKTVLAKSKPRKSKTINPRKKKELSFEEDDDEEFSQYSEEEEVKKTKNKKNNKEIEIDEEKETKRNQRGSSAKKSTTTKKEDKKDEMVVDNPAAKNLLKSLQIKKEIKEKDVTKLTLKERIALRARNGTIDQYLKVINKSETGGTKAGNEGGQSEFLKAKTNPEESVISSKEERGNKKRRIDDDDEMVG